MPMTEKVTYCEDKVYRWTYEMPAFGNKAIFRTVVTVSAIAYIVPLVILMGIFAGKGEFVSGMRTLLPIYLLCGLALVVIVIVSYYAVGKYYGGRFVFLYEMDETGVTFRRLEEDEEKTKNIAELAMLTGYLTKNPGLVGAGLSTSVNDSAFSDFSKLYSIKADPETDMIALTSFMLYNQIFVPHEDYEFVLNFIETHSGKKARFI